MLDAFFEDEPVNDLSEDEIAWYTKDWDMVDKLAEAYKEKPENLLFSCLESITFSKQDISAEQEEQYNKFWVDSALSQHVDCIIPVYYMNIIGSELSDRDHFRYYLHSISQGKRYGKWAKFVDSPEELLILSLIAKKYGINNHDAKMYREIMEAKNNFNLELKKLKPMATDNFIKSIIKSKPDQNKMIKLVKAW